MSYKPVSPAVQRAAKTIFWFLKGTSVNSTSMYTTSWRGHGPFHTQLMSLYETANCRLPWRYLFK